MRVASQAAELLEDLRKLGNIGKISKNGWRQSLVPTLRSKNRTVALVVKNYAKKGIKIFSDCLILLVLLTLFHKFYPQL